MPIIVDIKLAPTSLALKSMLLKDTNKTIKIANINILNIKPPLRSLTALMIS